MMWGMDWFPSYYFSLYSDDVLFFDTYSINTSGKACAALFANFVLTAINVYIRKTVSSWQINYLNSPHIPRSDLESFLTIQMTVATYTLFVSLSGAVNIFLIFSNFWFLVTQTISNVLVTVCMTGIFLKEKQQAELEEREINEQRKYVEMDMCRQAMNPTSEKNSHDRYGQDHDIKNRHITHAPTRLPRNENIYKRAYFDSGNTVLQL
ncbi:hypothetical protein CYMTET_41396 [Cymbomonas tetramitiformis]|uniref:Uncharacterized protein n=1 Tax=Cymbomonas tetramitiformis TaxID=36881 RepID=A0AAE0C647_9CHLO|nr:hypothetical protein CYMTET_41396 [Cymbomonas tetramitiformis]